MCVLPDSYRAGVDAGVNKSIQSFRLIGCHKPGQPPRRKKLLTPEEDTPLDAVISQGAKAVLGRPAGTYVPPAQDSRPAPLKGQEEIVLRCGAALTEDELKSHAAFR